MIQEKEFKAEVERLLKSFDGADEKKLATLWGIIEQAALERLYLDKLNKQAKRSGLVEFHAENPNVQRALPVSSEIARHTASLTNILDKLCKHLSTNSEEFDDALSEFE